MNWIILIVSVVIYVILISIAYLSKTVTLPILESMMTIAVPVIIASGFYFAWKQFDAIRKARMAEIILSLTGRWDSKALEDSRTAINVIGKGDDLKEEIKQAHKQNKPELYPLVRVGNFFDTMGELINRGYLDKDMAYDIFGKAAIHYANLYSGILKDADFKDFFKCYQKLNEIFKQVEAGKTKTKPAPT